MILPCQVPASTEPTNTEESMVVPSMTPWIPLRPARRGRPGRRGTRTARRRLLPARRRTHLLLLHSIPWRAAGRVARRRLAMTAARRSGREDEAAAARWRQTRKRIGGERCAGKVLLPRHLPATGKEEWGRRWSVAG